MNYSNNIKISNREKNKAFKKWKENFFFKKTAKILIDKVLEIKSEFQNILLLTSDFNETIRELSSIKYKNLIYFSEYDFLSTSFFKNARFHKVYGEFENIPLKKNNFDLVICNFSLNRVQSKKRILNNLFNLLSDDGLFICNLFGEKTFYELKSSFIEADEFFFNGSFTRMPKNIGMTEFTNLLIENGFSEVVTEVINFELFYKNIITILKDIRDAGENQIFTKNIKPISKGYLNYLEKIYNKKFKLRATLDIISSSCWKQKK